jgi:hypothetical protein
VLLYSLRNNYYWQSRIQTMIGPGTSRMRGRAGRRYRPSGGSFVVVRECRCQPTILWREVALEGTDAFLECDILAHGFVRLRCGGRSVGGSGRIDQGRGRLFLA